MIKALSILNNTVGHMMIIVIKNGHILVKCTSNEYTPIIDHMVVEEFYIIKFGHIMGVKVWSYPYEYAFGCIIIFFLFS